MSAEAAAEFIDVVKDYPLGLTGRRAVRAVDGVSFAIKPGEVFGLLGPNRAGKTTLVKILLSLASASSGTVNRLGRPVADRATLGRVGYVHESHAFPRYLSAEALLHFYGSLTLVPAEDLNRRVPVLLDKIGLSDRKNDPVAGYSKGMLQRLGVGQALLNDPELLVFDEPNEGLDLFGKALVKEIIAEQRKLKRTVVLVSHALHEVEELCDRVAVLFNGKLRYLGDQPGLMAKYPKAKSLETALQALYEAKP